MQLEISILNGERKGQSFLIEEMIVPSHPHFWLKDSEAIELSLVAPSNFTSASLYLYDHKIDATRYEFVDEDYIRFTWTPKARAYSKFELLFFNFFGVAEFTVRLEDREENFISTAQFDAIEVLASKARARSVEDMIVYLSRLGEDQLHALFQTTKFGADFKYGGDSPNGNLERIESTLSRIEFIIPRILMRPLSKLSPEKKMLFANGEEHLDESAISWLAGNLSVLETTDDPHRAHLEHDGEYYKANVIQTSVLVEKTDIYENQVIHGALELLLTEVSALLCDYRATIGSNIPKNVKHPLGYVSFFSQINRFKTNLFDSQIKRCNQVILSLKRLKRELDSRLPVERSYLSRPMLTPKAQANHSYRAIFIEYIDWIERRKPDWSVYKNLMAITSVDKLFELYSFYRIDESLQKILYESSQHSWVLGSSELKLLYEPNYWMPKHKNSFEAELVNAEKNTIQRNSSFKERAQNKVYSRRTPDFAIEIRTNDKPVKLIVLDAKYTSREKAFVEYLPSCTMKYAHGIQYKSVSGSPVSSITIVHPSESGSFDSFHTDEQSVFGELSATLAIQSIGICLDDNRDQDRLSELIKGLILHTGIDIFVSDPDTEKMVMNSFPLTRNKLLNFER
ncbi:nuclease domain-containing protein [Vibrio sp. Sgm 5]|uniref:nuclease domain-containing protein n=1 Tax=Vibrio sp. Sgm 5 TaxID=2994387 RepID=UPI0022496444|nr:nuclease domain-containing protein [Vibrio sp. Sgm 5]MCX2788331.1 nuclease domain-containing protein [Vibrio sp. Sgm 5]